MKKLSKSARALLVSKMNYLIANSPLPESRQTFINSFTCLLVECNSYKGFNYVEWEESGYSKWVADGRPGDNTHYLGDQTKINFI